MYRGQEIVFKDLAGGMASNYPVTSIPPNKALLIKNMVIIPGQGIEKRQGDTVFNSSAVSGAGAITGLGYYKNVSNADFLLAISGSAIYQSTALDGTFTAITGAVTITSSQNNIWTFSQMNDLAIFVGGAPNAPIKWNGTGNAAVLAGSPPSGAFGFQVNNRFFIGSTAANPSRIYWSILANPEDWSGTGSGSSDIWTNDGDNLTGAAVLNNDVVLLFKQRSIHQMVVRSAPFPVYPLFKNVGCVGKNANVVIDGMCYFISGATGGLVMKATDGSQITEFPGDIEDVWGSLNMSRVSYIYGFRYTGTGFDHLVWLCSTASSTTNDLAIIWDLDNKCWLQHTTGYKANVAALTQAGVLYAGHYAGKVYKKDVANVYSDASETAPGAIEGLWRWGWQSSNSFMGSSHPFKMVVAMQSQSVGSLTISYGFDFRTDTQVESVSMVNAGFTIGVSIIGIDYLGLNADVARTVFIKGYGNFFQATFSNIIVDQQFRINGFSLALKKSQQRELSAA